MEHVILNKINIRFLFAWETIKWILIYCNLIKIVKQGIEARNLVKFAVKLCMRVGFETFAWRWKIQSSKVDVTPWSSI